MEQSPQAVEKQPLSFQNILEEMNEEEKEAIRVLFLYLNQRHAFYVSDFFQLNFTRNALTEILLEVTNQLIAGQASKCFERAKSKGSWVDFLSVKLLLNSLAFVQLYLCILVENIANTCGLQLHIYYVSLFICLFIKLQQNK